MGPFTGHKDQITSVAFSPDGQHIISGSADKTICVWNAITGERVGGPFTGHTNWVLSVAFSPDGNHFVSGSADETVRMWDVPTELRGTVTGPLTEHKPASVTFFTDGKFISSAKLVIVHMLITTGNTPTPESVDFTDHSIINEEGWICGSNGELLIWIPLIHRAHLHRPSNVWVAGEHETHMDLSTFVHGYNWATCFDA